MSDGPESYKSFNELIQEPSVRPDKKSLARRSFDEMAGLEEQIQRLRTFIEIFDQLGADDEYGITRKQGILLVGPSGVGKSELAAIFADELGASFQEISGSEIIDSYVGNSARNLRRKFEDAKKIEGRVVLFFDEFDGIFSRDSSGNTGVANAINTEMKNIMKSVENEYPNVVVVGATNELKGFDPALLRPGRFEIIQISLPNSRERMAIWGRYIVRFEHLHDLESIQPKLEDISVQTDHMSGAAIKAIAEMARYKLKHDRERASKNSDEALLITHRDILSMIAKYKQQQHNLD